MANLTSEQQTALEQWAADGATLNDIQQRLKTEFGVNLTYLDARLLLLDLQVKLKDKKPAEPGKVEAPAAAPEAPDEPEPPASTGGVKMTVDQVTVPGAVISGKVTFTDGKTVGWYLDQMGRPGLRAPEPGYQPPPQDIPGFQAELDRVLLEAGF